jgi:hypothetical protein
LKLLSCIGVRLRITKSTASINLLSNDGARTFTSVKTAAAISAVGVAGARSGDKLLSSTVSSAVAGGRCLSGNGTKRSGLSGSRSGGCLPAKGLCCVVVRLRITKSAASINLLGDDRPGAFARIEAAAAISAVGVTRARTSDELCALSDDQQGHWWKCVLAGNYGMEGLEQKSAKLTIQQNENK